MSAPLNPGERVRFTTGPLGVLSSPGVFEADLFVNRGDEGRYAEPHPLEPGWHHITIERQGAIYVVPCESSMFERVY